MKNKNTSKEIRAIRGNIGWVFSKTPIAAYEYENRPSNVREAFDQAASLLGMPGSPLVFSEKACKSAADSPFIRPQILWSYFQTLHRVAKLCSTQGGRIGMDWKVWFQRNGINTYRGDISRTAEGEFGQEYRCVHEGREFVGRQHFTIGCGDANSCLSIHFARDYQVGRIIITHCGRHLSNTSS